MTDLFTVDFSSLDNDARHSAIAEFARAQSSEGSRHDFKKVWNDEMVTDVAGFANTFGGILVIGVNKGQQDVQARLVGVESDSELTTRIASSIATNISPSPSYDIAECFKPGEANTRFCIIRIRNDGLLHLVTKKGIKHHVWFRNIDESKPADAAQLRMMIDREREVVTDVDNDFSAARADKLFEGMRIARSNGTTSNSFLKLALLPLEKRSMSLDLGSDNEFVHLVHNHYRHLQSAVIENVAADTIDRYHDSFEYRWYHLSNEFESRWRVTNRLETAYATQIEVAGKWSLVDAVLHCLILLNMGATWWKSLGYFGDGALIAQLSIQKIGRFGEEQLALARGAANQFVSLFNPGRQHFCMNDEVLDLDQQGKRTFATGSVHLNFANMRDGIPDLVTNLMNALMRGLGHGVLTDKFKEDVAVIAR